MEWDKEEHQGNSESNDRGFYTAYKRIHLEGLCFGMKVGSNQQEEKLLEREDWHCLSNQYFLLW